MAKNFKDFPDDFGEMARELDKSFNRIMPEKIANEGINFFQERFNEGGWRSRGFYPWRPRKDGTDPGRALLVKNGHLRDSIRSPIKTRSMVVFAAGNNRVNYARIHNEGGTTHPTVTDKMRGYAWAQWRHTGASKWRGIATTKKSQLTVNIPRRRYMGHSYALDLRLEKRVFDKEMNRIFNPV